MRRRDDDNESLSCCCCCSLLLIVIISTWKRNIISFSVLGRPRESRGVFKLNLSKSSSAIVSSSSLGRSSSSSPSHNRVYKKNFNFFFREWRRKKPLTNHTWVSLWIYIWWCCVWFSGNFLFISHRIIALLSSVVVVYSEEMTKKKISKNLLCELLNYCEWSEENPILKREGFLRSSRKVK